jgi:hypothetical protein
MMTLAVNNTKASATGGNMAGVFWPANRNQYVNVMANQWQYVAYQLNGINGEKQWLINIES